MRRHLCYLKYVLRHKWFVFVESLRLGVPIWIAIFHDWDKFLPDEWLAYARTFYKPDGSKQYVESAEFAKAWMLHQHRNKHHWQWWLWVDMPDNNCAIHLPKSNFLVWDRGEAQEVVERHSLSKTWMELRGIAPWWTLVADPMPDVYRREMLADWRGAGRALGRPDTRAWYLANKANIILHAETRAWIEAQLGIAK